MGRRKTEGGGGRETIENQPPMRYQKSFTSKFKMEF